MSEEERKRGRRPGFIMSQEHRDKIRNSNILNALIEHVVSGREMSATQVTAGLGLLKKALPDLSAVTLQGDEEGGPVNVLHRIERIIVDPKQPADTDSEGFPPAA